MKRHVADESQAVRSALASRFQDQEPEINRAVLDRIRTIFDPASEPDASYLVGLEKAVAEALDDTVKALERGPDALPGRPAVALAQTRRAAREGVRLDTVLRRYWAGGKIIEDFIIEAAAELPNTLLRQVLNEHGHRVEQMMEAASRAYADEVEQDHRSAARRVADRVSELLTSDIRVAPPDLDYDFRSWHIGIILWGRDAVPTSRLLAQRLGFGALHAERDRELVWSWLGSRGQPSVAEFVRLARDQVPPTTSLAMGEPRRGLEGWRLTHREAQTALRVMWDGPNKVTRSRDVVLASAILSDEALVRSLLDTYLVPLEQPANGTEVLPNTLRAFFSASWNAAAAAEALGVDRHTVRKRVRRVERILDQPLSECSAELQVALRVAEVRKRSTAPRSQKGQFRP